MSIGSVLASAGKFIVNLVILPFSLAASLLTFLFGTVLSAVISSVLITVALFAGLYFAAKYFMSEKGAANVFDLPDGSSIKKVVKEKFKSSYCKINEATDGADKKVTVSATDDYTIHDYLDGFTTQKEGGKLEFHKGLRGLRTIDAANIEVHDEEYDPIPKGAANW